MNINYNLAGKIPGLTVSVDTSKFDMFTRVGNDAVYEIVKKFENKPFTEKLFWKCWAEVETLDFPETSDTAVREAVFRHLEDAS